MSRAMRISTVMNRGTPERPYGTLRLVDPARPQNTICLGFGSAPGEAEDPVLWRLRDDLYPDQATLTHIRDVGPCV